MARTTRVLLTDDIDGSEATGTVSFALDGVAYEIDLNDGNARQLREQLAVWTDKARRVGGRRSTSSRSASSSNETARIRTWAKDNGYEISERGRISTEIREAYNAAH
jgi:hypothetical protein